MNHEQHYDAVVVGSGPNGLAAAVTLARQGHSVLVLEAHDQIGGGTRSAELTLPGFLHDVCSSVHPLGVASPFFQSLDLHQHDLDWIFPPTSVAHPLDDGSAVLVERSIEATAQGLGIDYEAYCRRMVPLAAGWPILREDVLGLPPYPPRHPVHFARFGLNALRPATDLGRSWFRGERARALFAGMAAHSMLPLDRLTTGGFAILMLVLAHVAGFPVARGGSQQIGAALSQVLRANGGEIRTGVKIEDMEEIPKAAKIFFDLTPKQVLQLKNLRLPSFYRSQLQRFRYGVGVFKVDIAIEGVIPWKTQDCQRTVTVHLGGEMEEIIRSERMVWEGKHSENPFVILAQSSLYDRSRAPEGRNTVWAYCHTPSGSTLDMSDRIIAQIERFAPGFSNRILAVHKMNAVDMETYNPNYVGGDINGGVQDIRQFLTRPVPKLVPYATPAKGIYLCSSSTPPGGGVHGMCGYNAAGVALRQN